MVETWDRLADWMPINSSFSCVGLITYLLPIICIKHLSAGTNCDKNFNIIHSPNLRGDLHIFICIAISISQFQCNHCNFIYSTFHGWADMSRDSLGFSGEGDSAVLMWGTRPKCKLYSFTIELFEGMARRTINANLVICKYSSEVNEDWVRLQALPLSSWPRLLYVGILRTMARELLGTWAHVVHNDEGNWIYYY